MDPRLGDMGVRIAFDIDNVLADIIASARQALARDLSVREEEIVLTNVYWQPFSHEDPVIADSLVLEHAFWDRSDVLRGCPVLPRALEAVRLAERNGALAAYVTRRPDAVRGITQWWLDSNGFPMAPLHHVGTTDAATTYDLCKSTICRQVGATHLIDDHATEIAKARSAGIEVVVVDAPVGREARMEVMAATPGASLARDALQAVEIALGLHRLAA